MPGKNNTNNGQDAVFLTNTALRSRLRHKVLTRSRALSLPENTASDSQATKSSISPMIFGKNERSCTLRTTSELLSKGAEIAAIWQSLYYSCLACRQIIIQTLPKRRIIRFQNKNAVAFAADVFFHSPNNSYP